jgi:hypothetical protein
MKNRLAMILLATFLVYLGIGCNKATATNGEGSANITVKGSALSLDDIDRITVTVSGSDINPDIVNDITGDPDNGWSGTIENIPAGGGRTFTAEAFDAGNNILYSGSASDVSISDGETVEVIIYLQQDDPPSPFFNSVPRFESLVLSDSTPEPGDDVQLTATVIDPDGDPLTYAWSASCGTFTDSTTASTTWTAPSVSGVCTLIVFGNGSNERYGCHKYRY